jgi:sigma-B regulation protein RsbU (phosphoserine phosphatase)
LLLLYTDGVTEGASVTHELWGDARLLECVTRRAAEPCAALVRHVADEVRAFEGETGPADDVTLLAARAIAKG